MPRSLAKGGWFGDSCWDVVTGIGGGPDMWGSLALAILLGGVLAFVPGALVLWALGLDALDAVCGSTPVSVVLYTLWGAVLFELGLAGAVPVLVAVGATAAFAMLAALLLRRRHGRALPTGPGLLLGVTRGDWLMVVLFAAFNLAVMTVFYLLPLDGPSSVLQTNDNVAHLTHLRTMVDAGDFSTIRTSFYEDVADEAQVPFQVSHFTYYPEGWHMVPALACSLVGVGLGVMENGWNFVLYALVWPLGVFGLLRAVSPGGRRGRLVEAGGAVACSAGAMFPLRSALVHATYPNNAGFCFAWAVAFLVVRAAGERGVGEGPKDEPARPRAGLWVAVALALLGAASAHPNAAIFAVVLCAPYVLLRAIPRGVVRRVRDGRKARRRTRLLQVGFLVLCLVAWAALYVSPVMAGVVSYRWQFLGMSPLEALGSVLSYGYLLGLPQWLLCACLVVGACLAARDPRLRWLVLSWALLVLVHVANVSSESLRGLLAGFWYTDTERTAALATIAGVPLAAVGLAGLVELACHGIALIQGRFGRAGRGEDVARGGAVGEGVARSEDGPDAVAAGVAGARRAPQPRPLVAALLLSLFAAAVFLVEGHLPDGDENQTALGLTYVQLTNDNWRSSPEQTYTAKEHEFVLSVLDVVPTGEMVLNQPYDGSALASALDGLDVYYRAYGYEGEKEDSRLIREGLDLVASDAEVREAVLRTGARYVLVLSTDDYELTGDWYASRYVSFGAYGWRGFDITPETPGFTLVATDGENCLYHIDGTE